MIIMAVILLALSFITGFVWADYTPVTPSAGAISHTMELTKAPYHLDYTITYSFTLSDLETTPGGLSAAVSGTPSIASVSYSPADNFETAVGHKITKTAAVNWTGVTFSEPGIYYWKVTKSADQGGAPGVLSNNSEETWLFAFITDVNGILTPASTGLSTTSELKAKADLQDQYPAITVALSVGKTVDGNQGSKNQYFQFDISVTPAGSASRSYVISGYDPAETVNASLYNDSAVQPVSPVLMTGGQATEITVWLKHGQTFKIADLPYGSSYTVTETASGYTAEYTVSGDVKNLADNDIASGSGTSVSDSSQTADTTVQFTNTKNVTPPTGIDTRSAASVMGLILASALLVLVFVPKRREENH